MSFPQSPFAYNVHRLHPAIFVLEIDGNDHLGMTFLRAQEFYESVNPNIQFHSFTISEYAAWYRTQSPNGTFSYGQDWVGFNVPSTIIDQCYAVNTERTDYDTFFLAICAQCKSLAQQAGFEHYYLLGVRKGDTKTLSHEVAHGLFTVNSAYAQAQLTNVHALPQNITQYLHLWLHNKGYAHSVFDDETQAFLSTGLHTTMDKTLLQPHLHPFIQTFKDFYTPVPLSSDLCVYQGISI